MPSAPSGTVAVPHPSGARAAPARPLREQPVALAELAWPARAALAAALVLSLFVAMWNAAHYPGFLGFDANHHFDYAQQLLHTGSIPSQAEGGEWYTPPGFYALAAAALWIGQQLHLHDHGLRAVLYLDGLTTFATTLVVLALARLLAPRRPTVRIAAVGFMALAPIVATSGAMFHPEPLNMLLSAAAILVMARMLVNRSYPIRTLIVLAVLLGADQLVRSSSLFTFATIGITLLVVLLARSGSRRGKLRNLAITVLLIAAVASPWYGYELATYHTVRLGGFTYWYLHPAGPAEGGASLGIPSGTTIRAMADHPYRPNFTNEAFPTFYTDLWGDWYGVFSWSSYSQGPWNKAAAVMRDQQWIGILPTGLALAGFVGFWWAVLRRRRLELLPLALLPAIALPVFFYRAYALPNSIGDMLKPIYVLTTAPVWALAFAFAYDRLGFNRLARYSLLAAFLILAVYDLRFVLYGIRDHNVILWA